MNKIFVLSSLFVITALLSVMPVMAHVHPLVPADECGLGDGAGNTSDPQNGVNGQQFIGRGQFIPTANPGVANDNAFAFFTGPAGNGVGPAKDHCAALQ